MEDLTTLPNSEIERASTVLRDQLAKLHAEADKLDASAAAALKTFETNPTAKTATDKEVARQLAVNARAKLDEATTAAQPTFEERSRRERIARHKELRAQIDWRSVAEARATRIANVFDTFREALSEEFAALTQDLLRRNAIVDELNTLESLVGNGERHQRVAIDYLASFVNERLGHRFGDVARSGDGGEFVQLAHYFIDGRTDVGVINIQQRVRLA